MISSLASATAYVEPLLYRPVRVLTPDEMARFHAHIVAANRPYLNKEKANASLSQ